MKVKVSNQEIREYLDIETPDFPKYVAPLLNLVNKYAQGTRPRIVGQMTELIQQFSGKSLPEWEKWYLEEKPNAIAEATEKVWQKLKEIKNVMDKIDSSMVEMWIRDLVVVKTFVGLRFQEAILKKGADFKGCDFRFSKPVEESRGIDGFIGNIPVSIKPQTYQAKSSLPESIGVKIIYYNKVKDGIEIDFGELF